MQSDEQLLRANGMRVTRGRLQVLSALADAPHSDAEAVHTVLRQRGTLVTLQSIHNVLADLTKAGLLRRFEPARSSARFERRVGDNHHHAVCTECGRISDVDCVTDIAPCLHAQAPVGFAVMTAEVTFTGHCADCRTSR